MNRVRKFKISSITVLTTFCIGVSAWIIYNSSVFQAPRLDIPKAGWEKLFFKGINEVSDSAKLTRLRESHLGRNDIEIRMWKGFGLEELEAMIFRRIDGQWTAYYLRENRHAEPVRARVTQLFRAPKSGWKSFTEQIFDAGILTLPDAESIDCEVYDYLDGGGFVVEIYKDKVYRPYLYSYFAGEKCDEGKKINEIARIIAREFYNGVGKCERYEWLPCLSRDIK
ncbi:MAG: hypothetical protein R2747_18345 [Pyrinomonadaceae bacterium]